MTILSDSKQDPSLWCNLGFLYVDKSDLELAQEAFHKAQILDPDYAMSWVGQAVVASGLGDSGSSATLLEHAVSLSADFVSNYRSEPTSRSYSHSRFPILNLHIVHSVLSKRIHGAKASNRTWGSLPFLR